MMLPASRIAGKEGADGGVFMQRLDQLHLRAIHAGPGGRIDKHDPEARLFDMRLLKAHRPHDITPEGHGRVHVRHDNADVIETTELHGHGSQFSMTMAMP
jgi:hypothetical protein